MSNLTAAEMREYVQARWASVNVCDGSYRHYKRGTVLMVIRPHVFHECADIEAAYASTVARELEIQEAVVANELAWSITGEPGILLLRKLAEEHLAKLKEGWKL